MKIQLTGKAGFICKSLLWSLLLYACTSVIFHWQEVTNVFRRKEDSPVVVAGHIEKIPSIRIAVDSLQKRIHIADGVIHYLRMLLPRP